MYIETQRLLIRDFQANDANDLYEILGDAEVMEYCEPAYSFEQTTAFLNEFCISKKGAVAAVLKETNTLIGYILFNPLETDIYEIGWFFHKGYWQQGYAYEACSHIIEHAFSTLHAHKIVAETIDPIRSVRLMQKLGMKQEGIQRSHTRDLHGNWVDFYLYGILNE